MESYLVNCTCRSGEGKDQDAGGKDRGHSSASLPPGESVCLPGTTELSWTQGVLMSRPDVSKLRLSLTSE